MRDSESRPTALTSPIFEAATLEWLRQFIDRDHPDREAGGKTKTPGLARTKRIFRVLPGEASLL
jgi:hypothetical protein